MRIQSAHKQGIAEVSVPKTFDALTGAVLLDLETLNGIRFIELWEIRAFCSQIYNIQNVSDYNDLLPYTYA